MVSVAFVLSLARLLSLVDANAFLKKTFALEMSYFDQSVVEERLLGEVRAFLGSGHGDLNMASITSILKPMWLSLPKNAHGKLGNAQVRYALHRYFVQRHGWHIEGVADSGKPSFDGNGAITGILQEKVPAFIMKLFEDAFGTTGLLLHELAIFAATIEHIVHDDASDRLNDVYRALDLQRDQRVSAGNVFLAADAFLMSLIVGRRTLVNRTVVDFALRRIKSTYPGWRDVSMWLEDIVRTVDFSMRDRTNPFVHQRGFSHMQMEQLIERISEHFGRFQNYECGQLKDKLLEMEEGNTGRVKLSEFYAMGVKYGTYFSETAENLRQHGALDESKSGEARVIVANYIASPANCLAHTGFYSICCSNECESVLDRIERAVSAQQATPTRILEVVSKISTRTVSAGMLPEILVQRLGQIAAKHGGEVLLHGRLFAKWLHFLFPRECPYPHSASTDISPLSASEWMVVRNRSSLWSVAQMKEYIDNTTKKDNTIDGVVMTEDSTQSAWSEDEELLYEPVETRRAAALSASWIWLLIRALSAVGFVAVIVAAVAISAMKLQHADGGSYTMQKAHLV